VSSFLSEEELPPSEYLLEHTSMTRAGLREVATGLLLV
jgi:hypothetical protein